MAGPCWTCRKRTIQCDMSATPCAKCQKAGLECFETRPLRWVKGMAIRGKMRGVILENDQQTSAKTFSGTAKMRQLSYVDRQTSETCLNRPLFPLEDPCIQALNASSRFYLDYCSDSNPFRRLLSYAINGPDFLLRRGILALSARHYANSGHPFDEGFANASPRFLNANMDALHFKKQTIQALNEALTKPNTYQNSTLTPTILLLIFLDILESGIEGWNYHLRGAGEIVNFCGSIVESNSNNIDQFKTQDGSLRMDSDTRDFVARQFALISTLGDAFSGSSSHCDYFLDDTAGLRQESIIRSFLGCPDFLLGGIRYLSSQRYFFENLQHQRPDVIKYHLQETKSMLELIENFDCLDWASASLSSTSSSINARYLSLLGEAYKNAALLYGRRILGGFPCFDVIPSSSDEDLASRSLVIIDSLKGHAMLFKCLLWPTFIVGLACHTQETRDSVNRHLRTLWDLTSCLNIISASRILKEYWVEQDSRGFLRNVGHEMQPIDQGWLLI
ncbi:hypothetical protein VI817_008079 [Penicillium citrinum]|nr:hypothetical protein VI817_008079 [Penicillium citrinum]